MMQRILMYKLIYHPGSGCRQSKTFATIHEALQFSFQLKMFEFHDLYKVKE